MTRESYLCERCGARFHRGRKYCMNCGAMLSMPLRGRRRGDDEPTTGERMVRGGWIESGVLILLLGLLTYLGMLNVWAREAQKQVRVETGERYIDIDTGKVLKDNIKPDLVPRGQENKYGSKTIFVDDESQIPGIGKRHVTIKDKPENVEPAPVVRAVPRESVQAPIVIPIQIDTEVRDNSSRVEKVSAVKTGMTRAQVRKMWGEPKKVDAFKTAGGAKADRWYFGDPVLNLDLYSRYVEFDGSGIVVFVHDDYTKLIRMRPE
jgi:hypothetical protein